MPTSTSTMPEPTCPTAVRVDFAACWQVDGAHQYVYRVPCLQLLLVERGRLRAHAGGRWCSAGAGDLLCLGREPRNSYAWDGPTTFWECHLQVAAPPAVEGAALPALVRLGTQASAVREAMEGLCLALDRSGDAYRLRVQVAAWQILAAIAESLGRAPVRPRSDVWQRVRDRLDSAFDRPLPVAALAGDAGMSEDGFIRAFRKRHGLSPMAWRTQAKMRQACRLLGQGLAVKAVAARLGFIDPSAFTRAFRRAIGMPPTDYAVASPALAIPADAIRPFPLNRHILPPGTRGNAFVWG